MFRSELKLKFGHEEGYLNCLDSKPKRFRSLIYGAISYGGLVLIINTELDLPNMWISYLPMFIGVYVLTQWLVRQFGN